ncbi:MAG: PilZ domain-containing protein [Planctomycetota bacterium]
MHDREQRQFTRIALPFPISATSKEVEISEPTARDISAKGVFIYTTTALPIGTDCTVRIHVADWVVIEAKGKVVRTTDEGVGLEFTAISLPDFEHLRRIIQYNAEEPDQVLREFDEHLGLISK